MVCVLEKKEEKMKKKSAEKMKKKNGTIEVFLVYIVFMHSHA